MRSFSMPKADRLACGWRRRAGTGQIAQREVRRVRQIQIQWNAPRVLAHRRFGPGGRNGSGRGCLPLLLGLHRKFELQTGGQRIERQVVVQRLRSRCRTQGATSVSDRGGASGVVRLRGGGACPVHWQAWSAPPPKAAADRHKLPDQTAPPLRRPNDGTGISPASPAPQASSTRPRSRPARRCSGTACGLCGESPQTPAPVR